MDRQCRGLDTICTFWGEHMCTEEAIGVTIGDQLDKPANVARRKLLALGIMQSLLARRLLGA